MLEVLGDSARADAQGTGDAAVGPAPGCEFQDGELPVGKNGVVRRRCRFQGGACLVPAPGPVHGPADRLAHDGQQRAVVLGEIALSPVDRVGDELAGWRRQAKADLMLDPDRAEELRVQAQPVESFAADEIAHLDRAAVTGSDDVIDQGVLVNMGREHRRQVWVKPPGGVIGIERLALRRVYLVICDDITTYYAGQGRQDELS